MNFSTLSKTGVAASLCVALSGLSSGVAAGTLQDTIFAKVEPSGFARNRLFFRLSYINVNVKTTSRDAYDVTGPVFGKNDFTLLQNNPSMFTDESGISLSEKETIDGEDFYAAGGYHDPNIYQNFTNALVTDSGLCPSVAAGLGTPCGIKVKAESRVSTAAVSLGYYLDPEMSWAVEAFILAAPVKATVYGDGNNALVGRKLIESKMLPPIVMLGKYFGSSDGGFRPYVGLAASYAVFYDTRALPTLNTYQGGGSVSDTTVRIKNTWGFGPVLGLNLAPRGEGWSFGVSVGKLRYKTDSTLTTRNTVISDASEVLGDYTSTVRGAINVAKRQTGITATQDVGSYSEGDSVNLVTAMMCDLAKIKYNNTECNHGTFVRKASTTLDTTMVMFNVAKSF